MVSKNNKLTSQSKNAKEIPHYSLRKLSVGVVSVLLGTTLYWGVNNNAYADSQPTITESSEQVKGIPSSNDQQVTKGNQPTPSSQESSQGPNKQ